MFEVKKHLIKVQGNRLYLPVAARLVWFRQEHPDWGIETRPVVIDTDKQFAVFEAMVYNAEGKLMAKGTKMENVRGFPDYIEKAECVPLDTKILTINGWKMHDELKVGETVLGYNPETDSLEWVPLLAVRTYKDAPVVRMHNGKGFDALCTADHKWPVTYSATWKGKVYRYRKLRETRQLTKADALITCAPAPSGSLQVTSQQAFVMGMLLTDGSIRWKGKHVRAYICQSKPDAVRIIRERLAGVPCTERVTDAHLRSFPTGKTYACQSGYRWELNAAYMHSLLETFRIEHETELIFALPHMSYEAREAMLEAMMLGDGDKRGTFSQMPGRNSWIIDLWTSLCALQGKMACSARHNKSAGGIWTSRLKKTRRVWASNIQIDEAGTCDVWCPQTPLGTWVARFGNDMVAVTGNTGAIGRALAVCGFGTQFAPDLDEVTGGRIVDSPQPTGRPAFPSQPAIRNGNVNGNGAARGAENGYDLPDEAPARRQQPQQSSNGRNVSQEDGDTAGREERDAEPNRPHVAPTPVAVGDRDGGATSGSALEHECAGCGRGLTKGQEALSVRKYGIALCPDCQKERRTAEAAV